MMIETAFACVSLALPLTTACVSLAQAVADRLSNDNPWPRVSRPWFDRVPAPQWQGRGLDTLTPLTFDMRDIDSCEVSLVPAALPTGDLSTFQEWFLSATQAPILPSFDQDEIDQWCLASPAQQRARATGTRTQAKHLLNGFELNDWQAQAAHAVTHSVPCVALPTGTHEAQGTRNMKALATC